MSRADRMLIIALAVVLVVAWPLGIALAGHGTGRVTITGPSGVSVIGLDQDGTYRIDGTAGGLTVKVRAGAVSITEASCPDRVCVHTGEVRTPGSLIACVPNGVVVRVEGRDDGSFDAVVR